MRLFAIGDLHMSGGDEKPMDIFGPQWDRHFLRIKANWETTVGDGDTVLIPGDISWAMQLKDAREDLEQIGSLPGRKILCKGNHDYWWNSITQVRSALPPSVTALQHDAADLGDVVVCGTRGWLIPTAEQPLSEQDGKIYRREAERLRLALEQGRSMAGDRPLIAMTHYPPLLPGGEGHPVHRTPGVIRGPERRIRTPARRGDPERVFGCAPWRPVRTGLL